MKHPFMRYSRLTAALMLGAAAGLASVPAAAQITDISQTPLASASNLSVLPNVFFVLDDSGSMMFDGLPDNIERQQGASERRDWDKVWACKARQPATTGSRSGNLATHCDRIDPPFGAVEFNGMYYNPQFTYRRPMNYDGSLFPVQSATSASCDPFTSGWQCRDWYNINQGYYDNGSASNNGQTYTNSYIKQWYGTTNTFNVQAQWPEIVYCTASGDTTTDPDLCRRNGLVNSGNPRRHTGNPFRYTSARWGPDHNASGVAAQYQVGGGYPEVDRPVHEFFRQQGALDIEIHLAYPLTGAGSTVKIKPSTGTGTGTNGLDYRTGGTGTTNTCSSNTCTATVSSGGYVLTYRNQQTDQALAFGNLDLIVGVARTGSSVTVSNAFNHGFNVTDKVTLYKTDGTKWNDCTVTSISANQFLCSTSTSGTVALFDGYYRKTVLHNYPKMVRGNPFYYTIESIESCTDAALTNCTPGTANPYPAPVRWCVDLYDSQRLDTPSGNDRLNKTRCRKKYEEEAGYIYPRYGQFRRVDLTASSYSGRPLRTDCTARPTCSGTEELTNFVNWFTFYRTRMLMMKSASGVAFSPIDSRYRVGFITINSGSPVDSNKYLKIDTFTPTQKKAWYEVFYKQDPGGGTPLPEALSRAGRYFAGKHDGINKGMDDDPMQYSCQQNFAILTTDGYWGDSKGAKLDGSTMDNQDSNASKTPRPVYDGATDGVVGQDPDATNTPKYSAGSDYSSSGTLADVASYYYQTDLRPNGSIGALGTDVSENNVPTREDPFAATSATKTPTYQHMVTFGLGMAEGLMDWRPDYESSDAKGDFYSVRKGAINACSWVSGICNWPVPGTTANSKGPGNLDDLWHAAVNGRGKFFYARDTQSVQDGLNGALTSLQERNASGAAAATSTPNITPSDRGIFKTSYTTIQWNGDIIAQLIDPNNGNVLPSIVWSAKQQLQGRVDTDKDTRTIYLTDYSQSDGLKPFKYEDASWTGTEQAWFASKCTPASMSQCSLLDPVIEVPVADNGKTMVDFLRGQTAHEAEVYRDRQFALGDTVNAVPLYISKPRFAFGDKTSETYLDWKEKSAIKSRTPSLYIGANDGMLHAFNANTGDELWAIVPRQVAPSMWKLADNSYPTKHQYFVDGSPTSMDVWDGSTWRTILVGGLNAGGRGYYAVDVTNPNAPKALWEFCSDSSLCPVSDPNLGYSFGNPIITKRESDGKWVVLVTSGYNNVSPGDGQGHLYILDALTGKIDKTLDTGVGSTSKPSGLGRISAWSDNYFTDNTSRWVYSGDLEGNLWRFTLNDDDSSDPLYRVLKLGQALDASGKPQPITTRPELGLVDDLYRVVYVGTGSYIGVKDLTDPATQTPAGTGAWQQSIYAFKDEGKSYGNLRSSSYTLVQQTITELSGGLERTITHNLVNWGTQSGWYVDLNPGDKSPGERVTVDPQLALGTLLVATNVPGGGACAIGGDSWIYQFDYRTGSYVEGAPKNLVARKQTGALTVGVVIYQLQKGSLVGQVQRSETSMMKEDINTAPGSSPSRRTSWREITPELQ